MSLYNKEPLNVRQYTSSNYSFIFFWKILQSSWYEEYTGWLAWDEKTLYNNSKYKIASQELCNKMSYFKHYIITFQHSLFKKPEYVAENNGITVIEFTTRIWEFYAMAIINTVRVSSALTQLFPLLFIRMLERVI